MERTIADGEFGDLAQALEQARALLKAGDYAATVMQVREIRRQHANHPEALYLGGVAQRHLGELQQSRRWLQQAVNAAPSAAVVHYELALTWRALGKYNNAINTLQKAVALDNKLARAWQALGELLEDRGDLEPAENAFRHQMAAAARHPGLLQAASLVAEGKLGMAEGICRDYLYRYPTDVNAIRLLADIGLQLDIHEDAEKLLRRCLELAPDFHLARNNFANALSKGGKFSESMQELNYLQQVDPDNLAHPVLAASVMVNLGDYDGAIERYERVLAEVPGHSRLQMSLGHALKTVGRQADSVAAYRRAIAAEPGLGEAYWSLANLKTFRFADHDLRTMQNLVEAGEIEQRDEFHLCFALGKGLEDAGQYAESFLFYERGNLLKQQQSRYDPDENAQTFDHIIAHTSAGHFAERADYGHGASDPIFIVGLPRSGSTLLEQILASHPLVDGTMELPNILQFVRRLSGKKNRDDPSSYPQALWSMSAAECQALGQEYLDATRVQRGDAPFFIDKMPNNFAHVGLIHMILPNAKIIDARRQPLATCFSCFKQLFAAGQEFTYGLDVIGGYYRDYLRIMAHWDAVLPGRVLRVQYEDVIEDLEHQVRRMLDYCGLEFDARCLAFHENKRAVRTASSEQVRQPLYTDAVDQWRHFQAHLQPLREILGEETLGLTSP